MSVAATTREAVERHPFLRLALRAGVVNYAGAARFLDIGDPDAVAAALRRVAAELPPLEVASADVRIRVHSGAALADDADDPLLAVGSVIVVEDDTGTLSVLTVSGDLTPAYVGAVLTAVAEAGISIVATSIEASHLRIVCPSDEAVEALRAVELVAHPLSPNSTD